MHRHVEWEILLISVIAAKWERRVLKSQLVNHIHPVMTQ
jgi:hypothetical protein